MKKVLGIFLAALMLAVSAPVAFADFSSDASARLAYLVDREHARVCGSHMYRSAKTNALALWRSKDMALNRYFSHDIRSGGYYWDYLSSFGNNLSITSGENIAWNNAGDDAATYAYQQFMGSDGHRALIRNCRMNSFGVGAYAANGRKLFTVIFTRQPRRVVDVPVMAVRSGPSGGYEVRYRLARDERLLGFKRYGNGYWQGKTRLGPGWWYSGSTATP